MVGAAPFRNPHPDLPADFAEPTTAVRQAEVTAAKTMITRTAERLGIEPQG